MPIDPQVLRQASFFAPLDDDELDVLAAHIDEQSFAAGQTVFHEGDPGGTMHVVLQGRIDTFINDGDGERLVLDEVRPGGIFGELSLLDGGARSASAVAVERTRTFRIDRDDLERLFAKKPGAALDILAVLGRRLRNADKMLSERVARNANEVIAEKATLGDRIADGVARFGGSWTFIFSFAAVLLAWVALNTLAVVGREPFDPYPFILLNLFLSMLAAVQAPVIMMSQNRQDAKDRVRSELDYQVNLKAEVEIMELHDKLERLSAALLPAEPPGPAA